MTVATLGLAFTAGAWVVATAFLYLQWFHYMRQGYGLCAHVFPRDARGTGRRARDITTDLVIYLVPIYAIAARSATMGSTFLDLPVKTFVLPIEAITALGLAADSRRSHVGGSERSRLRTRHARSAVCGLRAVSHRDLPCRVRRD